MKNIKPIFLYVIITLLLIMNSCTNKQNADLIIHNAVIFSVDSTFGIYESMAISDGYIIDIGTNSEISKKYTSKESIDMDGKFVYPGFQDAHCHFSGYAEINAQYANLTNTKSFKEVIDKLNAHYDKYHPEFLCGRGWDQNDWADTDWPDNTILNELYPNIPVYLVRIDGHAALCNNKALEMAGIYTDMNIDGGIIHYKDGVITGILIDNAKEMVREIVPTITKDKYALALQQAEADCFEAGLISVTDAGLDIDEILFLDSLQQKGVLQIRINAMVTGNKENLDYLITNGLIQKDRLQAISIKLFSDGALGSRGACLTEPYSDDSSNYGVLVNTPKFLDSICKIAYDNNIQVCTHCIGDSANRLMLNIYGKYLKQKNDRRWRIEHAQVIHPTDVEKFGKYSIIPSIQATHATSDMYWVSDRIGGGRTAYAYIYKELLQQNGWLANGTDFPIEEIYPLYTFYASVFRTDHTGYPMGGFYSNQALSRMEALKSITIWAAKSAFTENYTGSLERGKTADIVVLDKDLMIASPEEILLTKVLYTFIDGKIVFKSNQTEDE